MPAITPPPGGASTAALIGRILLPFGIAYFFSFLYRTVNAVAGPEIAASLDLTPGDLGLVTSAYFLTFALFQIPLGILLDRYGPRIVEAALLVVAAGGALVFAMADSIMALAIGRGLIGLGVSACLMAALKANVQWFPAARLPLANGIILSMGGLGAIAATTPVQIALTMTDWRMIFIALAVMTVAVAALLFAVGPRHAKAGESESWGEAIRGAARIFRSPVFLRIAPLVVLSQATFLAYHGLWAAIWMRDVAAVPAADVAAILGIATTGIIFGSLGTGLIADRLRQRGVPVLRTALGFSLAFIAVQAALVFGLPVPEIALWTAFAFFGLSSMLYFAVLNAAFPPELGGRVSTAVNMLVFSSAFLLQWLVGVLLDPWEGADRIFAHRAIFGTLAGLQLAAILILPRHVATRDDPAAEESKS